MMDAAALALMGDDLEGPPWGAVMDRVLLPGWEAEPLGTLPGWPGLDEGPPWEGCFCEEAWLSLLGDLGTAGDCMVDNMIVHLG